MNPKTLIDEHRESHEGRYPRNDTLAKRMGITVEEAQGHLDRHRKDSGVRVRSEVVEEVETPAVKAVKVFDKVVVGGSIFAAATLDLGLTGFTLWTMGPSPAEKVAFSVMALIIVLFGLRALFVNKRRLFFMCAVVSAFLGTSFVLVGIDYQTNLTADDRELVKLESAEKVAGDYLSELQALQVTKGEGYKGQVEAQQKVFDAFAAKASEYRRMVAEKPKTAPEIKAYDILLAIPKALTGMTLDSRWAMLIALVLFGTVFWILQETMFVSVVTRSK